MKHIAQHIQKFLRDDSGPTAVEYAVMVSLIAVGVIVSVGQVATATKSSLNSSGAVIGGALST
jgi:pilus assembly protein Flp/PilA